MRTVLLDGESKVGKTSVGEAIVGGLETRGLQVYTADAGAFFRCLTAAVFGRLGLDTATAPHIDPRDLETELVKVIRDGDAHDGDWGDLEAEGIGKYVSVVGHHNEAVHASNEWYATTAQRALRSRADALVLNGRNPRERLVGEDIGTLAMELLVQCDPWVAGKRVLVKKGILRPTDDQIRQEAANVIHRRNLDRTRDTHPYHDPLYAVPYSLGDDAGAVLARSRQFDSVNPWPIRFETTDMLREDMAWGVQALARHAIGLVE